MSRDFLNKPPINRRGVSTKKNPIPKIPVNTIYEVDQEIRDDLCISPNGDPFALFPYQLSVFDNHIDIYSGDGRVIATVMRDNFTTPDEYLKTARLMAFSYYWFGVASYAMDYLGILHNSGTSSHEDTYDEVKETFNFMHSALHHSNRVPKSKKYEPVFYAAQGFEHETEMSYGDKAPTPSEMILSDILSDGDIPELGEEAYANGYA